jgi:hypothetical protein
LINGDYLQTPGAILTVEIENGLADLIVVTGDAFLEGILELVFVDLVFRQFDKNLRFLQVGGQVFVTSARLQLLGRQV